MKNFIDNGNDFVETEQNITSITKRDIKISNLKLKSVLRNIASGSPDTILSWTLVPNATQNKLKIGNVEMTIQAPVDNFNIKTLAYSDRNVVTVVAQADGYFDSDEANDVFYCAMITNLGLSHGANGVSIDFDYTNTGGAPCMICYLTNPNNEVRNFNLYTNSQNHGTLSVGTDYMSGNYKLSVIFSDTLSSANPTGDYITSEISFLMSAKLATPVLSGVIQ